MCLCVCVSLSGLVYVIVLPLYVFVFMCVMKNELSPFLILSRKIIFAWSGSDRVATLHAIADLKDYLQGWLTRVAEKLGVCVCMHV